MRKIYQRDSSKYTKEQKEHAKALYFQGLKYREIREITGISMNLISEIVNDQSIGQTNKYITENIEVVINNRSNTGSNLKPVKVTKTKSKVSFLDFILHEWMQERRRNASC